MNALPRVVLHVLNGAAGGAAKSTISVMQEMKRRGVSSVAVCHDAGTAEEKELLRDATDGKTVFTSLYWWNRKNRAARWKRPLIEARQCLRTGLGLRSTASVVQAARHHRAELIHSNTLLAPEGGLASMHLSLPHVWHVRELVGEGHPFRFPVEGVDFRRSFDRMASVWVANSHAAARAFSGWANPERVRVVPNGVMINAPVRRSPRWKPRIVAMMASLSSRMKRHDLFVDAAAALASTDLEFRIYGHSSSTDVYEASIRARIKRLGLTERVRIMGFRPAVEVLGEVDILVHPADAESFGRVAIEAMAAGIPFVGVNGGGIGEVVVHDKSGLLAMPGDPLDIARLIGRVADDEILRERLVAGGRARVEAHYSVSTMGESISDVYTRAMMHPVSPHASRAHTGPRA